VDVPHEISKDSIGQHRKVQACPDRLDLAEGANEKGSQNVMLFGREGAELSRVHHLRESAHLLCLSRRRGLALTQERCNFLPF
jgi:hypothetical protein